MKLRNVNYFQEGGAVAAPQGDPMQALLQGAAQAVQTQDCATAMQVCQMLVEMAGAQSAPQPESEPVPAGEPVYRTGGKLLRRI